MEVVKPRDRNVGSIDENEEVEGGGLDDSSDAGHDRIYWSQLDMDAEGKISTKSRTGLINVEDET